MLSFATLAISLMALGEFLPWYFAVPAAIALSIFVGIISSGR
jgi:hypothetical protein